MAASTATAMALACSPVPLTKSGAGEGPPAPPPLADLTTLPLPNSCYDPQSGASLQPQQHPEPAASDDAPLNGDMLQDSHVLPQLRAPGGEARGNGQEGEAQCAASSEEGKPLESLLPCLPNVANSSSDEGTRVPSSPANRETVVEQQGEHQVSKQASGGVQWHDKVAVVSEQGEGDSARFEEMPISTEPRSQKSRAASALSAASGISGELDLVEDGASDHHSGFRRPIYSSQGSTGSDSIFSQLLTEMDKEYNRVLKENSLLRRRLSMAPSSSPSSPTESPHSVAGLKSTHHAPSRWPKRETVAGGSATTLGGRTSVQTFLSLPQKEKASPGLPPAGGKKAQAQARQSQMPKRARTDPTALKDEEDDGETSQSAASPATNVVSRFVSRMSRMVPRPSTVPLRMTAVNLRRHAHGTGIGSSGRNSVDSLSSAAVVVPSSSSASSGLAAARAERTSSHRARIKAYRESKWESRRSSHAAASTDHAHNFKTFPTWSPQTDDDARRGAAALATRQKTGLLNQVAHQIPVQEEVNIIRGQYSRLSRFVLHPASNRRLVWDLAGFLLLGYDIITIPFMVAFEPDETTFQVVMNWVTLLFWTFDCVLTFFTGYHYRNGSIVMAPDMIAKRYLKSWFLLDCPVLSIDYTTLVTQLMSEDSSSSSRGDVSIVGRSLKTLRVARSIRLLRVMKLKPILEKVQDKINSEAVSIYFGLWKSLVGLVIANHMIACMWFYVGMVMGRDFEEESWIVASQMSDASIAYRYTTSLHWSLTQFTPASMEVRPYNVCERIVSVVVLLFGCIAFSSLVSTITASMNKIRAIHGEEAKQFWLLRRYMRQLHISNITATKVRRYLEYAWERQSKVVQESEVQLLNLLSEPLRQELKQENFAPHLRCHPFFGFLSSHTVQFVKALQAILMARGDIVFCFQQKADYMYFLASGSLDYSFGEEGDNGGEMWSGSSDGSSPAAEDDDEEDEYNMGSILTERLDNGSWFCESALWTPWEHLGDMVSLTECHLIGLSKEVLQSAAQTNRSVWFIFRRYAQQYVSFLNQLKPSELTDLSEKMIPSSKVLQHSKVDPRHRNKTVADQTMGQAWRQYFKVGQFWPRPGR